MSLAKRRSIHLKLKMPEDKMSTDTVDTDRRKDNMEKCNKKVEFPTKRVTFLTSNHPERKDAPRKRAPSPHPFKALRNNSKGQETERERNDDEK